MFQGEREAYGLCDPAYSNAHSGFHKRTVASENIKETNQLTLTIRHSCFFDLEQERRKRIDSVMDLFTSPEFEVHQRHCHKR